MCSPDVCVCVLDDENQQALLSITDEAGKIIAIVLCAHIALSSHI